jgi:hypothetical protein
MDKEEGQKDKEEKDEEFEENVKLRRKQLITKLEKHH